MTSIRDRAESRFEGLRAAGLSGTPIALGPPPAGWCISLIARLAQNAPHLVAPIEHLQDRLTPIGPLYRYPADSFHVSLLGCTQRELNPPSPNRLPPIQSVVAELASATPPVKVEIGRVNISGNQLFLEVLTNQPDWARTRVRLGEALQDIGEVPMLYDDPEPMHLNIARMTAEPNRSSLEQLLSREDLRLDASIELHVVELVITDFLVSPSTLQVATLLTLDSMSE